MLLLLAATACFGTEPDPTDGGQADDTPACDAPANGGAGPAPLLRLTKPQYVATVQQIFGADVDVEARLAPEGTGSYLGTTQPDVSQVAVESYDAAALAVGSHVGSNVERYAPCPDGSSLESARACAREFLGQVGTLVFRRPLTDGEVGKLISIHDVGFELGGYADGISLLVRAMLNSPHFLYRPEFGADGDAGPGQPVRLSGFELATRLSFAFMNRGPDSELLAKAATGELDTAGGLELEAARLANDERANDSFRSFFITWFGLGNFDTVEKNPLLFPSWNDSQRDLQYDQALGFFDDVLFGQDGSLGTLLGDGAAPSGRTPGLLGLPALLSTHSKPEESFPIYRGLFVREQLFCQQLPAPPPDIPELEPTAGGKTGRERLEHHTADPACAGCHDLIDPLGLAFENYDAVGSFRTHEQGQPIDPSGVLEGTDIDGPFANLDELAARMARSETVRTCVTRQWFRYVMQRFEQPADECSLSILGENFATSGYRFDALRHAIVTTPAFRLLRSPDNEVSQ